MNDLPKKKLFLSQEITRSIPDIIYLFILSCFLYFSNCSDSEFASFLGCFNFVVILFTFIDKKTYMSINKKSEPGTLDSRAIEAEQEVKNNNAPVDSKLKESKQ